MKRTQACAQWPLQLFVCCVASTSLALVSPQRAGVGWPAPFCIDRFWIVGLTARSGPGPLRGGVFSARLLSVLSFDSPESCMHAAPGSKRGDVSGRPAQGKTRGLRRVWPLLGQQVREDWNSRTRNLLAFPFGTGSRSRLPWKGA
ncbi:hypothetical protein AAFF_G00296800 [Aldrovandia affinis]|uniref:Secreted protein n=1 Tax=Aldrovandia affinis TaxID=143900 RepID=A0AAD7SPZ1_9TELE|nr:hypothetical protein AAFF_G00296800 [Aldrovandia affinis]